MTKTKFQSKKIGNGETFLVGMCPGHQRKKDATNIVWEGNKSGDLMQDIIKSFNNIYITNIFNYYTDSTISRELIDEGLNELKVDITNLKPKKIICFGNFAFKEVNNLQLKNVEITKVVHPSYILRFNMDKIKYVAETRSKIGSNN